MSNIGWFSSWLSKEESPKKKLRSNYLEPLSSSSSSTSSSNSILGKFQEEVWTSM